MNFKILSRSPYTGESHCYLYDNTLNHVFLQDGSLLTFKDFREKIGKEDDRTSFHPKGRSLEKLKIQVGLGCNLSCSYCGQRNYVPTSVRSIPVIPIVPSYEPNIDTFLHRLATHVKSVNKILLVGGEPFLYLHRIIPLVKGLRSIYPQARLSTITNGTLLTKELSDWLVDNRINLFVSHDGPTSSIYRNGKDCFSDEETLNAMRHYIDRNMNENLSLSLKVSVVVTPENVNLSKIQLWIESKLKRHCDVVFESIVKTNLETASKVHPFNQDAIATLAREVMLDVMKEDGKSPSDLKRRAMTLASRIARRTNLDRVRFACDVVQDNVLSCDLHGRVLVCAPYPAEKTAYCDLENATTKESSILKSWIERDECKSCPYLVSCLGGCAFQTKENHKVACTNLRYWHSILFIAAWFLLTREFIVEISPLAKGKSQQ